MPGTEVATLVGIVAPVGTPKGIVDKLQRVIADMVRKPDVIEKLIAIGVEPVGSTSEEFARSIAYDLERWSAVARRANIQPE